MDFARRIKTFVVKSKFRRKPSEAIIYDESDRNALALSRASLAVTPTGHGKVVFSISLIDRSRSKDWESVCINLYRTLLSIKNQTDPNWLVFVCGGDKPELFPKDERIIFLKHDKDRFPHVYEIEPGTGDKAEKRLQIISYMESEYQNDGYFFPIDADDIISARLVEWVRSGPWRDGFMIERGLKLDLKTMGIEELGPRGISGQRMTPMWSTCGTGTAVYFDLRPRSPLGMAFVRASLLQNHRRSPILATLAGCDIRALPFHAGVYLVNHGANITNWKVAADPQGTGPGEHRLSAILENEFKWRALSNELRAALEAK